MSERICGGGRRRRRVGRPRRRHGGSWLGDALSKAHNWIKSKKIVSTVANALGSVGVPYAGTIGSVARTLGYGPRRRRRVRRRRVAGGRRRVYRRRRVVHRRRRRVGGRRRVYRRRGRGGNLKSVLSNIHRFVKSNRLISKGLRHFAPNSKLSSAAESLGYGRKRGGNMFSTDQFAAMRL